VKRGGSRDEARIKDRVAFGQNKSVSAWCVGYAMNIEESHQFKKSRLEVPPMEPTSSQRADMNRRRSTLSNGL